MIKSIKPFNNISKSDVSLAGGKGASLGEMTQAGIPVPPGFVILSTAFDSFLKETDLIQEIDSILHKVNTEEIHTVEHASEVIQSLILSKTILKDIENEILSSFATLNSPLVAVRSSATSEDSASAAWAGQLDTYLNTSKENLLKNVQRCWASLFTPRAIFYRFEKRLDKENISVAVVVQKMVQSEKSGIAFSVHPVTEDFNQLIIEAGYGLGEAIVSGIITPDSYVVEKSTRNILDKNIQTQEKGLYRSEQGGNEWKDIPESLGERQVLSDKEILTLSELILTIEAHYGFPCDIEWAREGGKFFITQSRPITTIKGVPTKKNDLVTKYALNNSTWTYKGFHGVLHTFFPVSQTGPAMKDFFKESVQPTVFFVKDNYVHWYWNDNELIRIREKFFERLRADKHYLKKLQKEWGITIKKFNEILQEIDKTHLKKLTITQLVSLYQRFYKAYVDEFTYFMALGDAISMHADRYLVPEFEKVLRKDFSQIFPKLLTTQYLSFIEEENLERTRLLKIFKGNNFDKNDILEKHARKFFYIQNNYAKGIRLTAKDFKEILKNEKNLGITENIQEKQLKEKQKLIKEYKLSPWHQTLLYIMDEFFKIQDTRKKYVLISNYYQFEFLREAERRTGTAFELLQYSIFPEFQKILERNIDTDVLKQRKEICVCIHTNDHFEIVYGKEAENALEFFQKESGEKKELKGMVASTGKVRGIVKKILKIHDIINMEHGNILVSSMTRPEMVPAMKLACAIVTDEGGVTSHAAIVSRELGIPCIIGTKIATQVLKDGDLVEVDADNGVVRVLGVGKPSNYQRIFQLGGISYLFSDFFMDEYRKIHGLTMFAHGTLTIFLPKESIKETLVEGLKLYSNKSKFEDYKKGFENYKKETSKLFDTLSKKNELKEKEVAYFLDRLSHLFHLYRRTEFFATDEAYEFSLQDKTTRENLKQFEQIKNSGREYLNKLYFGSESYLAKILTILANQFHLTAEILSLYSKKDILSLFGNKHVSKQRLKDRKLAYVMIGNGNNIDYIDGKEAEKIVSTFDITQHEFHSEIKGKTAQKGVARGKAKVFIADYGNFDGLKKLMEAMDKGDILIAETTSPEFMPACSKASAIVTNQGGMMSHAAIVSREMGIPCIVGTGNVTDLIKDGDLVEVDADNGVVRVLEKKKV